MSARPRGTKELARQAWRRLRGGELTPRRAALSVAVGLVIGMTPAFGLHWLIVLAICVPLRLDTGVAYLAANISLPFIAPFITFAEIETGSLLVRGSFLPISPDDVTTVAIGTLLVELLVGTAVLAPLTGVVGGAATYGLVSWRRGRALRAVKEGNGT
ncbi:MAG: DUF2062 domain-containing protein [Labilithrix sp.]|nr:DUF2062 domain-containing protein [Labilithrix sp.]